MRTGKALFCIVMPHKMCDPLHHSLFLSALLQGAGVRLSWGAEWDLPGSFVIHNSSRCYSSQKSPIIPFVLKGFRCSEHRHSCCCLFCHLHCFSFAYVQMLQSKCALLYMPKPEHLDMDHLRDPGPNVFSWVTTLGSNIFIHCKDYLIVRAVPLPSLVLFMK